MCTLSLEVDNEVLRFRYRLVERSDRTQLFKITSKDNSVRLGAHVVLLDKYCYCDQI
jgi:hypothetical protein